MSSINTSGLIIPADTFNNHRNLPTFFDRPVKTGFWSEKTFDWYYQPISRAADTGNITLIEVNAIEQTHYDIHIDGNYLTSDITDIFINGMYLNISGVMYYNTLENIGSATSGTFKFITTLKGDTDINLAGCVGTYMIPMSGVASVISGSFPKTYYYMRPKKPVQHNGVVYAILEDNSGFLYLGPNGFDYKDDGIIYSDLIKYGNTVYGVGVTYSKNSLDEYNYNMVLTTIKRNKSTIISKYNASNSRDKTPKFVIHNGFLYVGIGYGKFLVKKPSHINLSLTSNL